MTISIIHPTRNRPKQALQTRYNWLKKADDIENIEYIFSLDTDDDNGIRGLRNPNKSAIEAINVAAKQAHGDILIVVSDDFDCEYNWDTLLLMELEGKEDFLVKTKDGIQPVLITLPIMDRKYYERFGYIYFPMYGHMYADTEMTTVGHMLGRVITLDILFPHLHYTTGKTPMDEINVKNDKTYAQGESLFAHREKNNFGIAEPFVKFSDIVWHP